MKRHLSIFCKLECVGTRLDKMHGISWKNWPDMAFSAQGKLLAWVNMNHWRGYFRAKAGFVLFLLSEQWLYFFYSSFYMN